MNFAAYLCNIHSWCYIYVIKSYRIDVKYLSLNNNLLTICLMFIIEVSLIFILHMDKISCEYDSSLSGTDINAMLCWYFVPSGIGLLWYVDYVEIKHWLIYFYYYVTSKLLIIFFVANWKCNCKSTSRKPSLSSFPSPAVAAPLPPAAAILYNMTITAENVVCKMCVFHINISSGSFTYQIKYFFSCR